MYRTLLLAAIGVFLLASESTGQIVGSYPRTGPPIVVNRVTTPTVRPFITLTQPRNIASRDIRPVSGLLGIVTGIPQPGPTGYYPYVIAREEDRDRLRATPIELRPNRPLHFYGNAVRRSLYR